MKTVTLVLASLTAALAFGDAGADAAECEAAVHDMVVGQQPALESLYHEHFGESGAGTGTLAFAVTVTADGHVDTVAVTDDSIGDEEFGDAAREVVRRWAMPRAIWGRVSQIELDFNPATSTYGARP